MKKIKLAAAILILLLISPPVKATSPNLVFVSNRNGNYEIYKKHLDTGQVVNLTNNPAGDFNPQLSPDGTQIVFYSDRAGNNQIYRFSLATPSSVTRLTNDGANDYDPTYMPDGRILYKSNYNDGYGDIWIMNADGFGKWNLTRSMPNTEEWKPDAISNTKIIFTSRRTTNKTDELYIEDLTTGAITRLTNNRVPDWYTEVRPDGLRVSFISKQRNNNPDSIYLMNPDGSGRTKITNGLAGDSDDPSWSPNGSIIFVNSSRGTYDIYSMNSDGSNVQALEVSSSEELSPIYAP